MKVVATYSIKGGVGKTATAVNLGYLAAAEGHRTMIWDLDPQSAATWYLRVEAEVEGGGKALVSGKIDPDTRLKGTDYEGLDLLPSDFSYRKMDLLLQKTHGKKGLRRVLAPLLDQYDYAIIDCPPAITLTSESVFRAADALLVPLIPTTLSLRTFEQLLAFREKKGLEDLRVLPFFSMVDRRKRLHREIMRSVAERYPDVLEAVIPYASNVELMGIERAPVPHYAPRSPAAAAYRALWRELRDRL